MPRKRGRRTQSSRRPAPWSDEARMSIWSGAGVDDPSITQERAHTKRKAKKDPLKRRKPGSVAKKAVAKKAGAAKAKRTQAHPKSKRSVKKTQGRIVESKLKGGQKAWARIGGHRRARRKIPLKGLRYGQADWDTAMTKRQGRGIARDTYSWSLEDKKPGSVARKAASKKGHTRMKKAPKTDPLSRSKGAITKGSAPNVRTRVQKSIFGVTFSNKPYKPGTMSKGVKRTKLFKPTTMKGIAKGLGRVGSKVAKSYANTVVAAAELSWDMGSSMAESHRKSGKRTALQKSRASTHRAAKAGKPRYGSFDAAIKADRRSQSLKPAKWTRVKVGGDWWNF